MQLTRKILLILSGLCLSSCVALITPDIESELTKLPVGQYTLDKNHSSLHFKLDHLGFSMQVGRFNEFDATLDFDPEDFSKSRLDGRIRTASVDFNNTGLDDTVRGDDWLDVQNYPEAVFTTVSTEQIAENTLRFTGDLTLLGVTNPVTLDVVFNGGGNNFLTRRYTLGFAATGVFKRSDFGMDSFIPAVGNEIFLDINAEFQRVE